MIVLIRSRHSSLCGFVALFHAMQALHSVGSLQCVRELQCPQTKRRIFWFDLWRSFNHNPWQWGSRSSFVSWDFLRLFQFWSHHLPRSATQTFQVRRFPSITQCLSCPTFASHNSILGNAQNCSCSIMMTNKDSLSHATCKRTDTVFSNFTKLSLQIAPLAFSIFDQFSVLSFFRHCRPILFMTCAAKRGSQLSNGLSSAMRTLVFCSAEF